MERKEFVLLSKASAWVEGIYIRDLLATTDKERYKQKELTWLM